MYMKVITELNRDKFKAIIPNNPGMFVVMYTAKWCEPCNKIKPYILERMNRLPDCVVCSVLDLDVNFDLVAYQKSLKQVTGIPALVCYTKAVTGEFAISGGDVNKIKAFFDEVESRL